MSMVPVLLEGQQNVLTYRFSQDYWSFSSTPSEHPVAGITTLMPASSSTSLGKLMARCVVVKPYRGNVMAQDDTESLPAVIDTSTCLSAVDMSSAAEGEDLPYLFAGIKMTIFLAALK